MTDQTTDSEASQNKLILCQMTAYDSVSLSDTAVTNSVQIIHAYTYITTHH